MRLGTTLLCLVAPALLWPASPSSADPICVVVSESDPITGPTTTVVSCESTPLPQMCAAEGRSLFGIWVYVKVCVPQIR